MLLWQGRPTVEGRGRRRQLDPALRVEVGEPAERLCWRSAPQRPAPPRPRLRSARTSWPCCAPTVAPETSFTDPKSLNNLIEKLDAASVKLTEGKNADAVEKLVDFQTTLNALATAPKPKVDPAVAQSLTTEAQGVIDCINVIGSA